IALAGGALTLYTQWPRTTSESVALAATVKPGLTFGQFLRATCLAAAGCGKYSEAQLRQRVVVVSVQITHISGYKGRELTESWQLGEAEGGAPIGEPHRVRSFHATLASDEQALEPFSLPLPAK